ncbi:MAG: glycoside hydrolase family 2 protein, partial [Thermomicrobiales bacterium]
ADTEVRPYTVRGSQACISLIQGNDMTEISLSGEWQFRLNGENGWQPISVPGCWEALGLPKNTSGPAWYRRTLDVPAAFAGKRLWLRFGGVSYDCVVYVNGDEVGRHTGLWDAFDVEITGVARPGETAEVLVRVEKPASLSDGPRSEPVPGSFPTDETLAGFLPYVWGHIFGGVWQDVSLVATGPVVISGVHIQGAADGTVQVDVELSDSSPVTLTIADPDGITYFRERRDGDGTVGFRTRLPEPRPWSPRQPDLYTARVELADDAHETVRFGLRSVAVEGTTLLLNGRPIYPRMALSWGWYSDNLHSNPGPERVRADLEQLKRLGYNGVKLCLWFPPRYFFELADELGMLLWVEFPMWLPKASAFFPRQTSVEYERLAKQARNHPSVMLYTLGCELQGRDVTADLLGMLHDRVKPLVGDALVRDNSGSGEAYGGPLNEHAEFYDYHFYCDLPFFRNLIDFFTPRWRPEMPWFFGEYCDLDTFRDPRPFLEAAAGPPWWMEEDERHNPVGARWQYDVVDHERRLRESGYWERADELTRWSEQQALIHRKFILELTRTYREISGYVVTGERDTPVSTAGMWDDHGRLKFDPAAFRAFNDDQVLALGWDKRRTWIAGGDRAAYWDTFSLTAGDLVRPHLVLSHYGAASGRAAVRWSVGYPGETPFARGEAVSAFTLTPGTVREIAIAEFVAPEVRSPRQVVFHAAVDIGGETTSNTWPLWFFPRDVWVDVAEAALVDPLGRLSDLWTLAPGLRSSLDGAEVVVATSWSDEIDRFVTNGGSAILLQAEAGPLGPLPTVAMPFWREAVRVAEDHPAWQDFPHDNCPCLPFFGCATDHALDTTAAGGDASPILRRVDTRTLRVHDYATELRWGAGRLIVSTLRFEGGQGEQPLGIGRNTAASYLLRCWVRYLGVRR